VDCAIRDLGEALFHARCDMGGGLIISFCFGAVGEGCLWWGRWDGMRYDGIRRVALLVMGAVLARSTERLIQSRPVFSAEGVSLPVKSIDFPLD